MTYEPKTLQDAMALWVAHGGADGGIVGDAAHARRATYHNGWDRVVARLGTTSMSVAASKDYTYAQKRDQVKSNAAMGIDLSWPASDKRPLYKFGTWLVEQCKAGAPDTADIREVIWSPDGVYVKRWDHVSKQVYTSLRKNSDGSITILKTGQGDASHFWHDHISCYRDSESRAALLALLRRYFEEDDDAMISFPVPEEPTWAYLKNNPADATQSVVLHRYSDFRALSTGNIRLSPPRKKKPEGSPFYRLRYVGGWGAATDPKSVRIVAYEPEEPDTNVSSTAMFVRATEVQKYEAAPPPAPIDPEPLAKAAYNAALDAADAAIGAIPRRT